MLARSMNKALDVLRKAYADLDWVISIEAVGNDRIVINTPDGSIPYSAEWIGEKLLLTELPAPSTA